MNFPAALRVRLEQAGQAHVLQFWSQLTAQSQHDFSQQLLAIDWQELAELRRLIAVRKETDSVRTADDQVQLANDLSTAVTPSCLRLRDAGNRPTPVDAIACGSSALRAGRIGAIMMAGGQGSRLGCAGPKGLYKVGSLSEASLFELLLGKLVAVKRRYGCDVPLAIMTSSATDTQTRQFLDDHAHCGLNPAAVFIFCQRDLPALSPATGCLLLEAPDRLAMAPDGHGGMLTALASSRGLDWFARQGVEHIVSFQVDNPLALPLDPEFLGYHLLTKSDFSTQVVHKKDPVERVGVVVKMYGVSRVIEYSDLPVALAAERLSDGSLRLHAGSIGVHAFSQKFLDKAAARSDSLPLHLALKTVAVIDNAGNPAVSSTPNAFKFERFIFDLMPLATQVCVIEIDAAEGFAPLKNRPGSASDALEHVRAALLSHARHILQKAGVSVAEGVSVEIDSASIVDEDDIARLFAPGAHIDYPLIISNSNLTEPK